MHIIQPNPLKIKDDCRADPPIPPLLFGSVLYSDVYSSFGSIL
jgi:hypothetical protein